MARGAAELALRASYGRLVALLGTRAKDIGSAEDALSEAFVAALVQWPRDGVPESPEAWLIAAAKRRLVDEARRDVVRSREAALIALEVEGLSQRADDEPFPDERLRLLFVCTHPAIDADAQIGLMLQTVLGMDAVAIGSAMCVAPKTMGQRLWRAKAKIREAAIPFVVPERSELPERVDAVLEAIYAAFGTGWDDERISGLAEEAIFLGRLVVSLLPDDAEAMGLLALMLFADARKSARRTAEGAFVPLEAQDPAVWNAPAMDEAERYLREAFLRGRPGPYQLEAAIQQAHVVGARSGRPDVLGIAALYDGLVQLAPSLGARVGRAAAWLDARGSEAALAMLDAIDDPRAQAYQPYWAVRAEALARTRRGEEARACYQRAIGLTADAATRAFLSARAAST